MSSNTQPLQIAIIGAGIGGLTLALSLSRLVPKDQLQIHVYEQAQEIKEIGSGILFWPRTWAILQKLEVTGALEKYLDYKPNNDKVLIWKIKRADQENCVDIFDFYNEGGGNFFRRASVQQALLGSLPASVHIHLSHRLQSYEESMDNVTLTFENGSTQKCALLVGADGINSLTRKLFISKRLPEQTDSIDPAWGGSIAYRCLMNPEGLRKKFPNHESLSKPVLYAGNGKYIITYPIAQGKLINLVPLVTDESKTGTRYEGPTTMLADKEKVKEFFEGWSEEVKVLIQAIDACSQWAIQYVSPLESFAFGRIALLGDAAHAMLPSLGSGAGQAIEDAYTLSHLISKAIQNHITIDRVTKAYTKTRQPLANLVAKQSSEMAKLVSCNVPASNEDVVVDKFRHDFFEKFQWWNTYPVEKELERSLEML